MKRVGQIFRDGLVNRVKDGIDSNSSIFLLSYSNLDNTKIGDLRMKLNNAGANVYVAKNSIARLALKDLEHAELADKVSGQTAFVWSNEDSVTISKIIMDFTKEFEEALNVQGGVLDGRVLEQGDVKRLSDLPSKEVLQAQLLGIIQAPITRLMSAMNAKSRDLLSILKQYSEQKGGN